MGSASMTIGSTSFIMRLDSNGQVVIPWASDPMLTTSPSGFEAECHECMFEEADLAACTVELVTPTSVFSPQSPKDAPGFEGSPIGIVGATHVSWLLDFSTVPGNAVKITMQGQGYPPPPPVEMYTPLYSLFNLGRLSNRALPEFPAAQANFSYRMPMYMFMEPRSFEYEASIQDAGAKDPIEVQLGHECTMVAAGLSGARIKFYPLVTVMAPDQVCPSGAGCDNLMTAKVFGPPGANFNLLMEPVANTGGHIDYLHCNEVRSRPSGNFAGDTSNQFEGTLDANGEIEIGYEAGIVAGEEDPKPIFELPGNFFYSVLPEKSVFGFGRWLRMRVPSITSVIGDSQYHEQVYRESQASPCATASWHSNNYNHGTAELVSAIQQLSYEWFYDNLNPNNERLTIKDMSLEWGGVLCVHADWGPPHTEHRSGSNADISLRDWSPEQDDKILQIARGIPGCESSIEEFDDMPNEHLHLRCF